MTLRASSTGPCVEERYRTRQLFNISMDKENVADAYSIKVGRCWLTLSNPR